MRNRGRLTKLLDRIKMIELFLTTREEELEEKKLALWKEEKVGMREGLEGRNASLEC